MAVTQLWAGRTPTETFIGTTTATRYVAPCDWRGGAYGSEADAQVRVLIDCNLRNWFLKQSAVAGGGATRTYTIRLDGVDTAAVIAIGPTETEGSYTGADISILGGSTPGGVLLSCSIAVSGGTPAATGITYSLETVGVNPGEQWYGFFPGTVTLSSPSRSSVLGHGPGFLTAAFGEAYAWDVIAIPGTFTRMSFDASVAPGAGTSRTLTFYKESAATSATATLSDAETTGVAEIAVAVVPSDLVHTETSVSGSPATATGRASFAFVADVDGVSMWASNNAGSTVMGVHGTTWSSPRANLPQGSGETEATRQVTLLGPTPISITSMQVVQWYGSNYNSYTLRKNAIDVMTVAPVMFNHVPPHISRRSITPDVPVTAIQGESLVHRLDVGVFYTVGTCRVSYAVTAMSTPAGIGGVFGPLALVHKQRRLTDGAIVIESYSDTAIASPGGYENGFKDALVEQFDWCERSLSDRWTGEWRGPTARLRLLDPDFRFRQQLAGATDRYWVPPWQIKMTTRANHAALGLWYTVFNGVPVEIKPARPLGLDITLSDFVAQTLLGDDHEIPWRKIRDGFLSQLDVVSDRLDRQTPEPRIYGQHRRVPGVDPASPQGFEWEPIYLGLWTIAGEQRHVGLIAGHACANLEDIRIDSASVLADEGTEWWLPGHAGYIAVFGSDTFMDLRSDTFGNLRRYTLVFGKVTDLSAESPTDPDAWALGQKTLTVLVDGVEPNGDGTGAVMTDRIQQFKHWMINDVANAGHLSYQSGPWLTTPLWTVYGATVQKIDEDSFDTCSAIALERFPGDGYIGAAILGARAGDQASLRVWIAEWARSCGLRYFISRLGRFTVTMLHPTEAVKAAAPLYTDSTEISDGSYDADILMSEQLNRLSFRTDYEHRSGIWQTADVISEDDSVANYDRPIQNAQPEEYPFAPGITMATHIAIINLRQRKHPPRRYVIEQQVETDPADDVIAYLECGDYARVRAYPAVANAPDEIRLAQVETIGINPGTRMMRAVCLDVEDLIDFDVPDEPGASVSPSNDTCAAAIDLNGSPEQFDVEIDTSANQTDESLNGSPSPLEFPAFNAAWFTITPSSDGRLFVTTFESDYDTQMAIVTGICGSSPTDWTLVGYNDNDGVLTTSVLDVEVTGGQQYYIVVTGIGSPSGGRLKLAGQVYQV